MSASFYDLMKFSKTGIASPEMTHYDKQRALAAFGNAFPVATLSGVPPISFKSNGKPLTAWSIAGNMAQDSGTTNVPSASVTVVGVESGTDYAYFALSDFPGASVGDTITVNVSGTNYSQKVMKIDSSYVYIENRTV